MSNTEVETIGVRLTLDAAGYIGKAEAVTAANNAMSTSAQKAASGASQMRAAGGAQVAGGGRAVTGTGPSTSQMAAVNVPLTVNAESLATLRAAIIKGIGSIPINITPTVSKSIATEAKNVVAAVSTPAIGTRSGAARAVETAVRNNLPTRAHGGAVQQGRDVLVGERGPEIIRPRSSGMVLPDINAYHREQARLRKAEAELAALEYQIQQRGKRRAAANRGGYSESEIRQLELLAAKLQGGENISARAQGGPAHKGGLPRGYKIDILSRQSGDYDIGRTPGNSYLTPDTYAQHGYVQLGKGKSISSRGPKSYQKPLIYAPDVLAGVLAVVRKGDKTVATFPFDYHSDKEQWGVPTPYGSFHPNYSITDVEHRRKGLATAAYMKVERLTGRPIAPSNVQLSRGKAFWAQPNRPFGVRFGSRPMDRYDAEEAARDTRDSEALLQYEREARARRLAAPPVGIYCSTCGAAAGPFLSQSGLDAHISFSHTPWHETHPKTAPPEYIAARSITPRNPPPAFGQPLPTRTRTRAQRRNDPQEQMRRISYGENGPWTATSEWGGPSTGRAHVPQPAPAFGESQFIPDRPGVRFRARGGAVEISRLPEGGAHYAPRPEGLYHAIQDTINHYQDHSAPGGYVGVAPVGKGYAVQLHAPSGEIESWRILRNIKKAGFGAMAYRATMENEGGTFPLSGGPQPPKGYAVGIATGTSHLVEDPSNFRDFLKQFNAQKKSQLAAGSFPPYVGTWLHEGQIHIDPAAVLGRKREADMVARAKAQLAFFDLKRFDEIPTSSHRLRANAERIQQLIMAGRKRESGGMVENVRLSTLLPLLREDRETYPRTGQGATDLGELTGDIAARGIQKPIALRYDPSHHAAMVDDGNHRLAVARRLGLETVPAYAISSGPQSKRHYKLVGLSGSPVDAPRGALLAPSSIGLRADGGWVVPSSTHQSPLRGLLRLPENARDLHANIRAHAETIKPGVIEAARDWWTIAHAQAVGDLMDPIIGGKTSWQSLGMDALSGLGAFAAASSGQEWRSNRAIVRHLLETGVPQTSGSSNVPGFGETSFSAGRGLGPIEDAWAFLMGREGSPTGPKRGAMFQNITGLDPNAITYDSRMSQIITAARRHTGPNSKTFWKAPAGSDMIRKLGIGAMEDLYPEYAKRWDLHNLSEFQAILWSGLDTNVNAAHKGAGLGTDWLRTQRGISIPRHPGLEIPFHRAAGGPALGGMTPPLNQIAHPGFVSSMFQTAADWANDPFMAIMAWQQQQEAHKARGGDVKRTDLWGGFRAERLAAYRARQRVMPTRDVVGVPRLGMDFAGGPMGDQMLSPEMKAARIVKHNTFWLNAMTKTMPTGWDWASTYTKKYRHAEGGPVQGPLQRRLLGLPDTPEITTKLPKEPEWMRRARENRLPPKVYRADGGPVSHLFTVADQLGLHMRPSAHLARMAADFDAFISVENLTRGMPQKGVVNAKYMHHLLALGARQGDQLRLRATGTDAEAAVRALGGMIESPGLTRIASANRSLEKVDSQRMRAAEIFAKFTGRAGGGDTPKGLYIVGEIGKELFVPNRLTHLIPKRVMDQIPKAAGGMQIIGQKPNSLFAPPEDGIIVPNRLMDQVPHMAPGGRTKAERIRAGIQEGLARADVWGDPGPIPFLEATPPPTRRRAAPSSALLEIEAIERADREKVVAATIKKARSGRAQYMPSRENMGEELAVMRAGAGKVMPSRTPAGAVAAVSSFLFGGVQQMGKAERERVEAANAYTSAFNRTNRAVGEGRAAQVALRMDLDEGRIHQTDYSKALRGVVEPIREAKRVEAQRLDVLKEATAKAMPTTGGVLKNLGVIIGATTAYGMAMQLASTVITDAAIPALGKVVDQMTGFKSTATATTTALGQATYEAHGNTQATLAQAGVTAGLSADMLKFVSDALSASVNAKAGAKAQQETSNLFRAATGSQGQTAPQGLFGGYGGVLGSSLFGEQMGGGKGFQEIVAGDINTRRGPQVNLGSDLQTGIDYVSDPSYRQYVNRKGNLPAAAQGALGMSGVPFASDIAKFAAPFAGPLGPMLQDLVSPAAAQPWVSPKTTMGAAPASDIETYMNDLNASGKRAQDSLGKTTKVTYEWATSLDEVTKASDIAVAAGDKFGLDLAQNSGIIVKVNGQIAKSVKDYQDAVAQVNLGKTIVDAQTWAQLNVRQLTAQKQARQAQQQLTMALEIPYATTKNLLQQPLVAPGLGFFPGATTGKPSAAAAGMTGPAAGMAQQALASSAGSNVRLGAIAGQGMVQALNQVGQFNPASLPNFAMLAIQSQMSAARIADLTTKMGKLNQKSSQFNWDNQIRIATRTLGDALGMLGKAGGTALGKMEGAMHRLDIQGTQLGLQLQQRGITTALAQAQFQAPGQTGEERFFAQKEAIAKAGIQQEQLNISTQQFNLSKQIWIENANRAATDAQRAIEVMVSSRDAEKATIAAQESIAATQQDLAAKVALMQTLVGQADTNWSTVTGAALSGISQFSGALDEGVTAIYKALGYNVSSKNGVNTFKAGSGPSQYGPDTVTTTSPGGGFTASPGSGEWSSGGGGTGGFSSSGTGTLTSDQFAKFTAWTLANPGASQAKINAEFKSLGVPGFATGFLGTTTGMSQMTVGEAGAETIAVLRNPRSMMGGGSSRPASVELTSTNITSWMRAIQTSFPKVGLTDTTIGSWVKALQDGFVNLSDKTITALGGGISTAAGGSKSGKTSADQTETGAPGTTTDYTAARIKELADRLSKKTGLDPTVAAQWIRAEQGVNGNVLGTTYDSDPNKKGYQAALYKYNSQEAGIDAAASWVNTHQNMSGIANAITTGNAATERNAIINSPWNAGHYNNGAGWPYAAGVLGATTGATNLTVGEAGRETVAILRNPRTSTLGGGGIGPMNLTVNINGASVRNDQDISEMARQVAAEVERTLSRKGQMLGLRGPAV